MHYITWIRQILYTMHWVLKTWIKYFISVLHVTKTGTTQVKLPFLSEYPVDTLHEDEPETTPGRSNARIDYDEYQEGSTNAGNQGIPDQSNEL